MSNTIATNKPEKKYRVSEVFRSIQGEGKYTGVTTIWVRFFLCNLTCSGFGQDNPTDPSTYDLPYEDFDVSSVDKIEDLPVWEKGCDSSYSWAKKFRHLVPEYTIKELADKVEELLPRNRKFFDDANPIHLCFTGGEPMINQDAIGALIYELINRGNKPHNITIETNGTKPLKTVLKQLITNQYRFQKDCEWFWSYSPKLFTVSGEQSKRAIKHDVVLEYSDYSDAGQFKPVLGIKDEQWMEWYERYEYSWWSELNWPVYIMACGATKEDQDEIQREVCERAMANGYNFSARVHCHIWGNQLGT